MSTPTLSQEESLPEFDRLTALWKEGWEGDKMDKEWGHAFALALHGVLQSVGGMCRRGKTVEEERDNALARLAGTRTDISTN